MEEVLHIKTKTYFYVPEEDFDKFQNIFAYYDTHDPEYGLIEVETSEEKFTRKYTDDEIKSIFWLHAEYTGIDKEIAKNNVVDLGDRDKAEKELKSFIKGKRRSLSIKTAKNLLKILKAFESYECEINN